MFSGPLRGQVHSVGAGGGGSFGALCERFPRVDFYALIWCEFLYGTALPISPWMVDKTPAPAEVLVRKKRTWLRGGP